MILDDALSELDASRQARLLERLVGVQTIITCTEADDRVFANVDHKTFTIEGGKIV